MRSFVTLFAIVGFCAAICCQANAEEPQAAKAQAAPQAQAEHEQHPAATTHAAADSNYRRFNGQWWYWLPQSKSWKIWNGNSWIDYQPGQTRTLSYDDGAAAQTYSNSYSPTYRQNFSGFPNSVSNTQIMGSYGFRSAGSKADGRY